MHFLQSEAWQNFQKQLGRKTYRQSGNGWEYMAILEKTKYSSRLYCPYGPFAVDQRSFEEALSSLLSLGRRLDVDFVRVEPTDVGFIRYIQSAGGKKVDYQSLNPEHSSEIDLTISEDDLISKMAQPVRNVYRNYQKKNMVIKTSIDPLEITILLDLLHDVAKRTGMRPHSDDYFWNQATSLFPVGAARLWYAEYDDKPIAAALFFDDSTTRIYAHAAANAAPELRKLNAGTALLAEAIVDAKRSGKQVFDLFGIAPDGASQRHPWSGFTRFKRSFGGADVQRAGSWDIIIKPRQYWIYRTYQTLRRLLG